MVAVRTIQRITKTMQMIATAKFTASLARSRSTRPYTDRIRTLVAQVAAAAGDVENPLLRSDGTSGTEIVLVIAADRGLCGTYNSNALRSAHRLIKERQAAGKQVEVYASGKKALAYFRFAKIAVAETLTIGDKPTFAEVQEVANRLMARFTEKQCDAVHVVYTRFISNARQSPEAIQLLPVSMPAKDAAATPSAAAVYEFSPDASTLVGELLPRAVKVSLLQAFNDAVVSENVMRMIAMKAATDNASGLGRTLKRDFNRARQARITTELTEIVSGAAALE